MCVGYRAFVEQLLAADDLGSARGGCQGAPHLRSLVAFGGEGYSLQP
jgi:hypothetical protein